MTSKVIVLSLSLVCSIALAEDIPIKDSSVDTEYCTHIATEILISRLDGTKDNKIRKDYLQAGEDKDMIDILLEDLSYPTHIDKHNREAEEICDSLHKEVVRKLDEIDNR